MTIEELRRVSLEGVELPVRAEVIVSRATPGEGYSADVEVLDGAGQPTGQILQAVPLDPLWLAEAGAGTWAPPAKGRIVAVTWMGGVSGHPVVVAGAAVDPPKPRLAVGDGEHSHQGATFDVRMKPDEWKVSDEAGTIISGTGKRWKVASPDDDLLLALVAVHEAQRDGVTIRDTDTNSGSAGRNLRLNGASKNAINAALDRVRAVLRS